MSRSFALALAVLTVTISTTAAGEVKGEWTRDDGKTRVRFASCGSDAVCGAITWLKDKDSPAKVGEQVFFDMKPSGENVWAGTAFNPDDGKRYSGKMTLNGDRLRSRRPHLQILQLDTGAIRRLAVRIKHLVTRHVS